ncbi:MAG: FAD-binding dehydrogenase [Alphaproteobacteria bacterium]|nr:FAD-binding dehydrogenase [Alphaproteobacteria bacterium]
MTQRYQCDVAIIGGGIAGVTAALELIAAGKSVAIFETEGQERFGGSALESFGGLFFVDSPEQRRARIADSCEKALKDWESFAQFGADELWPRKWAAHLVERATPDGRDYLRAKGLSWLPVVLWVERGLDVPGNSVPRFHLSWGTGKRVVTQIIAALRAHANAGRLQTHFHHRVERLETNGGRVVGCSGKSDAGDFTVDAGVTVVAAGGIGGSLAQVRKHWDPGRGAKPPETVLLGTHPSADGGALEAAQAIGAQLTHVGRMWNYAGGVRHPQPDWPDHGVSLVPPKSALWVDATGKRLMPPIVSGFDTHEMVRRVALAPHGYTWQILNRRIALKELAASGAAWNPAVRDRRLLKFVLDTITGNRWIVDALSKSPDFAAAATLGELVDKMNAMNNPVRVDANVLEGELKTFDATLDDSSWADDQRKQIETLRAYRGDRMRLAKNIAILDEKAAPLIAIREHVVTRKSLGGIVTDLQSRALDAKGEAIPGLYAAGESAGFGGGGSHGWRGLEGTFLLSSIITARRAAESITGGG